MPTTPGDAPLSEPPGHLIPAFAELYDKFAHSLDPFSKERDEAERVFLSQLSAFYDNLENPKPSFQDFRKGDYSVQAIFGRAGQTSR